MSSGGGAIRQAIHFGAGLEERAVSSGGGAGSSGGISGGGGGGGAGGGGGGEAGSGDAGPWRLATVLFAVLVAGDASGHGEAGWKALSLAVSVR